MSKVSEVQAVVKLLGASRAGHSPAPQEEAIEDELFFDGYVSCDEVNDQQEEATLSRIRRVSDGSCLDQQKQMILHQKLLVVGEFQKMRLK